VKRDLRGMTRASFMLDRAMLVRAYPEKVETTFPDHA
jgi:hypothetical protein